MVVHTFPPFRSVGHSIRVVKFLKYLPALGWQPVVLTVDDSKDYENMPRVGSESLFKEIPAGVKIHRAPLLEPSQQYLEKEEAFGKKNIFTRILVKLYGGSRRWIFRNLLIPDRVVTWFPAAIRLGRQIVKDENIDVIFATCPPYSVSLLGALLKKYTGKPFILDYRDDWIDTPPFHSRPGFFQMIERRMEKWAVTQADRVTLVTEGSRQAFLERYPDQPAEKFIYLANGVDLEEFASSEGAKSPHVGEKFTILHTGSLNDAKFWTRVPMAVFQAVHNIMERQPDLAAGISLAFTGTLPERQKDIANELGIADVVHELGFLPRDEWLRELKNASLLLVINYDDWATIIPGKIYEYWAANGPPIMLLSTPGAATEFVRKHNLGFTFDPYDVEGIEKVILDLYAQRMKGEPMKISSSGIEAFDRRELTRRLMQVLSTLV